jgi:CheY-like chemotaxis protein/HPt (histidine-containing phosphotransfer) domain-containing protein/anti-sigma regulatory factor (Ser/Thr protein kinase)
MSHEIRTPLNGIFGMISLLNATGLDDKQIKYVEILQNSSESLLSLINDILDFSKIEAGKAEIKNEIFNLSKIFEETITPLSVTAQQKGLEFYLYIDPQLDLEYLGDHSKLRQIIMNLISNAVKFTEKGYIYVKIESAYNNSLQNNSLQINSGQDKIHISVEDTGIGIEKSFHDKLFLSFTQLNSEDNRKYGGTGLGLAICKKLTKLLNGHLTFKSEPGKGTVFDFTVTLKKSKNLKIKDSYDFNLLKNNTFFIVGLDIKQNNIIKKYLESWQCKTLIFANINQLSDYICNENGDSNRSDAIKSDCIFLNLPVEEDQLRRISEDDLFKNLNLIVSFPLSRWSGKDYFDKRKTSKFIVRPVRYSELFKTAIAAMDIKAGVKDSQWDNVSINDLKSKNKRILIVEDNPVNQKVSKEVLTKLGYATHTVNNGLEALEALKKDSFDIVLMDCQMPKMDGFEATMRIRNNEAGPHNADIPIIALTAQSFDDSEAKCLNSGMNDFITKPFNFNIMEQVIDQLLTKPNVSRDIFDFQSIYKRLLNDREAVKEVLKIFLSDIPSQIENLKVFIDEKNYSMIESTAHKIKGAAANIGANQLKNEAENMENTAKIKTDTIILNSFVRIESEFEMPHQELCLNPYFRNSGLR